MQPTDFTRTSSRPANCSFSRSSTFPDSGRLAAGRHADADTVAARFSGGPHFGRMFFQIVKIHVASTFSILSSSSSAA